MKAKQKKGSPHLRSFRFKQLTLTALMIMFVAVCASAVFLLKTKEAVYDIVLVQEEAPSVSASSSPKVVSFPLGVNPAKETITEDPALISFLNTEIAQSKKENPSKMSWFRRTIIAKLVQFNWYQNLASPISRILVIEPGERREQVADNFGDILRWTSEERLTFSNIIASSSPELTEGKFYPGHYVVNSDASPEHVASLLQTKFTDEVSSRYTQEIQNVVPIEDAMIIASLLEREAYDFEDMRFIAGIIWNRLFIDMHLQIDASLQYAKATPEAWWPIVIPDDKYIDSPFNTYEHTGLPPAPIANPSSEALLAALNPKKTNCMFYFHDEDGGFHCTPTYEEHVMKLIEYFGRGK